MQNNLANFQEAVERARQIAQKLTASAPNASINSPLKRSNSDDEQSNKRPAITTPTQTNNIPSPVLRAQQIAQQINSQLGVKTTSDSLPLSNQLTFQEDYKIPDKFVGLIIGKGGEQIVRLQAESGCKVQICQTRPEPVPGGPNPPDRLANLCGTRDAIERARRIMDEIISKGKMADGQTVGLTSYSLGGGGTANKTIDVMLPSAKCGLVIGKGGENIKRVSEEFSVKMYVAQESSDIDGIEHKPLRIMGESDRVDRAKQHVLDSLSKSGGMTNAGNRVGANATGTGSFNDYGSRNGGTPMTGPCNEAVYHVPYDKAGLIIGKGGESIKEINRKAGAFVELDKSYVPPVSNSTERVFKLRGTPEQIVTAQQLMYEKVLNGPGGPGDILSPIEFQQQYSLPLVGSNSMETWNGSADQYGNGANATDPYSQWASAYGQWPQMSSYDDSTSKNANNASGAGANTAGMDPAWLAYYQSMNYYSMMQSTMGATASTGTTTKTTDSTTNTTAATSTTGAVNPTTGQPDYSQQWIEYYRSVGQNDFADEIAKQMKEPNSNSASSTTSSATNPWAGYLQQWSGAAATSTASNGNTTS